MASRVTAIAFVAFCVGVTVFLHSTSVAQKQADAKRKTVNTVIPLYPDLARKMQIRGTVKVEVTVAPNGTVKFTQVIGGSPVLTRAAVVAIEKWKWVTAPQETKELIELNFHPD